MCFFFCCCLALFHSFKKPLVLALGDCIAVRPWSDSPISCLAELRMVWKDKNEQCLLTGLRLYFLPENTPIGRNCHGEVCITLNLWHTVYACLECQNTLTLKINKSSKISDVEGERARETGSVCQRSMEKMSSKAKKIIAMVLKRLSRPHFVLGVVYYVAAINSANNFIRIYCRQSNICNPLSLHLNLFFPLASFVVEPKYMDEIVKQFSVTILLDTKFIGFCSFLPAAFGFRVLHSIFILDKYGVHVPNKCSPLF